MARGRRPLLSVCSELFPPRFRPIFPRKRLSELREASQVSLPIQSDKGTDQVQTALVSAVDIQVKMSSDIVTSTSKPQTPSSRLACPKRTLDSQVSLLPCYTRIQKIKSGSNHDQITLVSEIEELKAHIKKKDNEIELLKADNADIWTELLKNRTMTCFIMEQLKGSDRDQITLVSDIDIQEKLSSDIVSSTSKPHQAKHLRSSSKIHKRKAFQNKKKKSS